MKTIFSLFLSLVIPILTQAQELDFLFLDDLGTKYHTIERLENDDFLVGGRGPDGHASLVRFNSLGDTLERKKVSDSLGNSVVHTTVLENGDILVLLEHGQINKLSPDLQEIAELHQLHREYGEDYRVAQVNHTDSLWFITGIYEDSLGIRNHAFTEFNITNGSIHTLFTMAGRPYPMRGFYKVKDTIYASIMEVDSAILSVWRSAKGALIKVQKLTEKTGHIFGLSEVNDHLYVYGTIKDSVLPATFRGWLIKFNEDLSMEWQKEYKSSIPSLMNLSTKRFRKIIPLEGGEMLIVGQDFPGTNPYASHSYIGRYTSEGDVLWDTFYDVHSEVERFVDAVETSQKELMVVGYLDTDIAWWNVGYLMGISFETTSVNDLGFYPDIYPNPFKDHIRMSEACSEIQVFDITGRQIFEARYERTFDLGHLSPGTYVLKGHCQGQYFREVIVKGQ